MVVQMHRLDTISNNLANVDLVGYKKDTSIEKSFPELLLRRMNDDGVYKFPFGSVDTTPIVGKLGMGCEVNEVFTVFTQGAMKQTENVFDMALEGEGFFSVGTEEGERYTRNGSFLLNSESYLVTKNGDYVLGENGPIKIKANNFIIDEDGVIYRNSRFADDDQRLVSMAENDWDNIERVDRLKIVNVSRPRELKKVGHSKWMATPDSGEAEIIEEGKRPKVRQGFVEASNVNVVQEMVEMIEVNRSYEANQRLIQTEDALLGKLINEGVRV